MKSEEYIRYKNYQCNKTFYRNQKHNKAGNYIVTINRNNKKTNDCLARDSLLKMRETALYVHRYLMIRNACHIRDMVSVIVRK